ncbi:CPBP family intramembrane glutamic endopeptidase [Streptococcus entericus]|uniref:CPBP family intramembrane glutamic endopeptidase n=1 Tax=Streptococcus entericus TaxID=155680 RepID=UPI00037077BD|nr:CPBP family intramembrane glutamic endopeptidase [Streptococcus entericus]
MSDKKSVYSLATAYVAVMLLSFIYNLHIKGISYQDSGFIVAEIPFLLVLVAMTSWYVWKHHERLTLPNDISPQRHYFFIGFLPLVVTLILVWLGQSQFNVTVLLPLVGTLLVGFGEEFLFRRVLLPYFLKQFPTRKAIIYSALAFGAFHGINIFAGSDVKAVVAQVIMTTVLGFYYAHLYLFTQKIAWCAVDHGLWDYIVFNKTAASTPLFMWLLIAQLLLRIVLTIIMARRVAKITK